MYFNNVLKSAILALASSLLLSLIMAIAKMLDQNFPTIFLVFFRNIFALLLLLPTIKKKHIQLKKIPFKKLQFIRAILCLCAMFCTYYTYRNLPVAFATAFGMTGPFFTTILSLLFFKYPIHKIMWISLFLGYFGVILMICPTTIVFSWGIITSLLANILVACNMHITKILSKKMPTTAIIFYNNILVIGFTSFLCIPYWHTLNNKNWLILCLIGFLAYLRNFTNIQSIRYTHPAFISPFEYSRLLFGIGIGWYFFQEVPALYTIIGGMIIVFSSYLLTFCKEKKIFL